jgi:putative ABC transport system permease protein
MSLRTRIVNAFRPARVNREIDEELSAHLEDAQYDGRESAEAQRALGSQLKHRDYAHDARVVVWLDSLRADAVYGWRRLAHNKVTTAAAVLSLGLAIGACTAAFRLADALLWRPLPVVAPHEIYALGLAGEDYNGIPTVNEYSSYLMFARLRDAAKGNADLLAISYADHEDVSFAGGEPERVYLQYVSGSMFDCFGLKPAFGRLLTPQDDDKPSATPYAVISAQYWHRRFQKDPAVVGRTFRFGNHVFEIVGVAAAPFTGTEPGKMVDVFVPIAMNPYIEQPDLQFMRILARVPATSAPQLVTAELQPALHAFLEEQMNLRPGLPAKLRERILAYTLAIRPAPSGSSALQKENERPLLALCVLSALVLLIACVNVANLVMAQTAARERELALRVSIGGGSRRLMQLVLTESAWIGAFAALVGAAFAWWAAPLVTRMISTPDDPVRLALPADWRVFGFLSVTAFIVTLLFGFGPALRASRVDPAWALKGGENSHARRRLTYVLIAAQAAFCVAVLLAAGMFVKTFESLTHRPLGFSPDRILTIFGGFDDKQPAQTWTNLVQDLAQQPGIESASMAGWAIVDGTNWISSLTFDGAPTVRKPVQTFEITPGWTDTMRVPVLEGRAFNSSDTAPGSALVNQAFATQYFPGESSVGKSFHHPERDGAGDAFTIVGVLGNTCYDQLRDCAKPIIFLPYQEAPGLPATTRLATFVLRTNSLNPYAIAPELRAELARVAPSFHIMSVRTEQEVLASRTIQERLLSTLATFFAAIAIVLAGIGLYGVLAYSVIQRRREIGIRIAVGADAASIARTVIVAAFSMVCIGAAAGLIAGAFAVRPLQSIFYEVKVTDATALAMPAAVILIVAIVAALPVVIRAIRIDPVILLRSE